MMRAILLALALAAVVLGCDSESDGGDGRSGGLTQADAAVLNEIDAQVIAWNRASTAWSKTYRAGDREEILRTQNRRTQRMHEASVRIRLSASQIEDPDLRRLIRDIGDAYRRQLRAVVAVNDSVVNADLRAGQRAVARLQRAGENKIRVLERLVDRFPELGRDLTG